MHQLRHSALTHLAEQNVSLPLLMAKSRHTSLRSLQRYAAQAPKPSRRLPRPPTPPAAADGSLVTEARLGECALVLFVANGIDSRHS